MPIHDVGYRGWDGKKTNPLTRWKIITYTGIRLALRSRWVARILFLAWLPVMYWGIGFFFIENSLSKQSNGVVSAASVASKATLGTDISDDIGLGGGRKNIAAIIRRQYSMIPNVEVIATALETDDEAATRSGVWRWLLMTFFRYPQGMLILFMVGSIAPALVAKDIRTRAFLLYFSRPVGRLEYMIGKLLVPVAFIMMVTLVPAIALYFFAIMMSPDISVIWSTWDIPLRIMAATVVLVVPVASIAIMLSSLTQESRFANFAWFAVWAMGHGAWVAILFSIAVGKGMSPFSSAVTNDLVSKRWSSLSLYNNLGDVQSWVFGFQDFSQIYVSALVLAGATIFSLVVLFYRVSAPIRV